MFYDEDVRLLSSEPKDMNPLRKGWKKEEKTKVETNGKVDHIELAWSQTAAINAWCQNDLKMTDK